MHVDVERQIELICAGAVQVVDRKELADKIKRKKKLRVKFGADPSRRDLHLGHTVVLQKLRTLQELGHDIIFLIGDYTATIGDPTGRSETRNALDFKEAQENSVSYQEQVFKILDPKQTEVVFNSHWLMKMDVVGLLRLMSEYTLARMLERDDFQKRFEQHQPIRLHEFIYPLLQGYDSVHLSADLELGGTDQTFNLLVGRELQKSYGQEPQSIVTMPLLEGTDGVQKMSKSFNNAISLTDTPTDLFGKIMSVSDELMFRYYALLLGYTPSQLEELKSMHPRDVKADLGKRIVERYYDLATAEMALQNFNQIFKNKEDPSEAPSLQLKGSEPVWICQALKSAGAVASTSEARRLIESSAVSLANEKILDVQFQLRPEHHGEILRVGKKKFFKVDWVSS